jgi:hypothetical protein
MAITPIKEIHIGKTDDTKGLQIALQEIISKMNEIIQAVNSLLP